ncbi:putative RNA-directed DNA polymerase [Helianthus annuus]|nr:putative RNA-directed DNA polymerase [Helianthus annuus]
MDSNVIKLEAQKFFEAKFKETRPTRPAFVCPSLNKLLEVDAINLIRPFTFLEIKEAIWECASDKAPGPDDYNFGFIKHFWNVLKDDFLNFFEKFHLDGKISNGCGSSFLTLIPKVFDPLYFNEYRLISLIGCIPKTIYMVLARRIKPVMEG